MWHAQSNSVLLAMSFLINLTLTDAISLPMYTGYQQWSMNQRGRVLYGSS